MIWLNKMKRIVTGKLIMGICLCYECQCIVTWITLDVSIINCSSGGKETFLLNDILSGENQLLCNTKYLLWLFKISIYSTYPKLLPYTMDNAWGGCCNAVNTVGKNSLILWGCIRLSEFQVGNGGKYWNITVFLFQLSKAERVSIKSTCILMRYIMYYWQ